MMPDDGDLKGSPFSFAGTRVTLAEMGTLWSVRTPLPRRRRGVGGVGVQALPAALSQFEALFPLTRPLSRKRERGANQGGKRTQKRVRTSQECVTVPCPES
ncbi:hypothetical protein Rmet_6612 (plasmid) [Cupriavidus metallidurans CH34]|uniref:Uncharacterized protein n=1 Tax=Cupriavidus metallidurans (strain ATCC 43123 / DSM 2839 / NBRC 102507 / CH34) TaxID=266264 RepID=D3DY41_CUPMC|nr:hypothetical protein Rmet_6612 [Cupriavidus metallidurans CH34]